MKWQHLPKNRNGRLAHLQCELCEAGHAIAKVNRWGGHSRNPDKPDDPIENPCNIGELLFELWDIEYAVNAVMPDIVAFLKPELIANMRAAWETKAYQPEDDDQLELGLESDVPMRKCMVCDGVGAISTVVGKNTLKEVCKTCKGRGLVSANEPSPGEDGEEK